MTVDEVLARVEAADRAQIQARADTATRIAGDIERRRALLAAIDAAIGDKLAASTAMMTPWPNSPEFTGIRTANSAPGSGHTAGGGRNLRAARCPDVPPVPGRGRLMQCPKVPNSEQ